MGYAILTILALPIIAVSAFMLLIATGVFHEFDEAEEVARNYGLSWKSTARS